MAVDKTPSQVATSALQAIPFGSIIGGPLKACVEAQALAAKTTWEFIQNVGINVNPETVRRQQSMFLSLSSRADVWSS